MTNKFLNLQWLAKCQIYLSGIGNEMLWISVQGSMSSFLNSSKILFARCMSPLLPVERSGRSNSLQRKIKIFWKDLKERLMNKFSQTSSLLRCQFQFHNFNSRSLSDNELWPHTPLGSIFWTTFLSLEPEASVINLTNSCRFSFSLEPSIKVMLGFSSYKSYWMSPSYLPSSVWWTCVALCTARWRQKPCWWVCAWGLQRCPSNSAELQDLIELQTVFLLPYFPDWLQVRSPPTSPEVGPDLYCQAGSLKSKNTEILKVGNKSDINRAIRWQLFDFCPGFLFVFS